MLPFKTKKYIHGLRLLVDMLASRLKRRWFSSWHYITS